MQATQVPSLGWECPPEKGMAKHSSILAWRIPWTEKPGGPQSMESQRARHDQATNTFTSLGKQRQDIIPGNVSKRCGCGVEVGMNLIWTNKWEKVFPRRTHRCEPCAEGKIWLSLALSRNCDYIAMEGSIISSATISRLFAKNKKLHLIMKVDPVRFPTYSSFQVIFIFCVYLKAIKFCNKSLTHSLTFKSKQVAS